MSISRGLAALIFIIFFQTTLVAEYLYKDDVVQNSKLNEKVESLGQELYQKTGISLKLVMIRDLPYKIDIQEYQKTIMTEFREPTILLVFAELDSKVDIFVNDTSLYKYFNRDQVLSPVASLAQAVAMGVFFADSFDHFLEFINNSGGTILPLLGAKSKDGETAGKYAAAMFNGYVDVAVQIAQSKNVTLNNVGQQGGKYILLGLKIIFYGIILMALVMYIRKKLYERRINSGLNK